MLQMLEPVMNSVNRIANSFGGLAGNRGMSGTLTNASIILIYNTLAAFGVGLNDLIVDAGSGTGELLLKFWLLADLAGPRLLGYELCRLKSEKSRDICSHLMQLLLIDPDPAVRHLIENCVHERRPQFKVKNAATMRALPSGTTIVTAFCVGWSPSDLLRLRELCRRLTGLRYIVWIARGTTPLQSQLHPGPDQPHVVAQHGVRMAGSREQFQAYFIGAQHV